MSKYSREFFRDDDSRPRRGPRLRVARQLIPIVIENLEKKEEIQGIIELKEMAKLWLSEKSSGFNGRAARSKEEIFQFRIDAAEILIKYNRYYADDDEKIEFSNW